MKANEVIAKIEATANKIYGKIDDTNSSIIENRRLK